MKAAKEREAKAEKEAKERAQQTRANAQKRPPTSPRTNTSASGSQRQQQNQASASAPKKILTKPPAQSTSQPPRQQPQGRPSSQMGCTNATCDADHAWAPTRSSAFVPALIPRRYASIPPTPVFAQQQNIPIPMGAPPMISPRMPFAAAPGGSPYGAYGPVGGMQQMPLPLGHSVVPRGYGVGPGAPFDQGFGRGLAPAAPIGPPSKMGLAIGGPLGIITPASASTILAPGAGPSSAAPGGAISGRRVSAAAPDPGPITRPIAPIARPTTTTDSGSGSGFWRSFAISTLAQSQGAAGFVSSCGRRRRSGHLTVSS